MMVVADEVTKSLGGRPILHGLSFTCAGGAITALTGRNGAGKSTLLRIVAGVLAPDRGVVSIAGSDLARAPRAARRALGYVPEAANPPGHMTGAEVLDLVRALKQCEPIASDLRQTLDVDAFAHQRMSRMSLGQRRRICLAAALTGDPRVLVLDGPTNGLDAAGVETLAGLLEQCRDRGCAILLATHDAEFIAPLADARLHIAQGRLDDQPPGAA